MKDTRSATRLVSSLVVGLLAMAPAIAEDPLGTLGTTTGPTPIVEGLLGTAVIVGGCPSPASVPVGLTWDGSHLWVAEFGTRRAFRVDPSDCSVVSSFQLPGTFPAGLAFDGTYLWHADSNSDMYYQIDPSDGSVVSSFASPGIFPTGLAFHAGDVWGADVGCLNSACADNIYVTSPLGVLQNTLAPPAAFPTGLASDGVNLWHSDNNSDLIYKINPAGFTVLDSFPAPGSFSNDLAWDGRFLWVAETQNEQLFQLDVGTPLLSRSQGFWKHQCSDNGFHHYSDAELAELFSEVELQSGAFSECAELSCDIFFAEGSKKDMLPKALSQLLAVWLNVVSGRQSLDTVIDLGDLTDAESVGEAIDEVESVICDAEATRGELGNAKDIAEAIIFLNHDFDIQSSASIVSVPSGRSEKVTVGLVNMGLTPTDYDLSATSSSWPVSLSPQRVTGLPPGGVAVITITSEAPALSTAGDTSVVVFTAQDQDARFALQHDLSLVFQVPGTGGGGSKRVLKEE